MGLLWGSYDLGIRVLRRLSPLVRGSPKLVDGVRGRREALNLLEGWARSHRDPGRPLVWIHAPSVGEGLQARAVLEVLKERQPDLQVVYTYFSPSAARIARFLSADVAVYLPWDVRSELARLLAVLRPGAVVFTRTEVWPGLAAAAAAAGIPTVLSGATLSEGSGRLRPLARAVLGSTFASLSKVLVIASEDGGRFLRLGVRPERIDVTGDPSVDSAWERVSAADPAAPYLTPFADHPVPILVAGSTWESDEAVLAPAIAELRATGRPSPGAGAPITAIVAPHEPTEAHLARLEGELARAGLPAERLAVIERRGTVEPGTVVLVDRIGVLAHLYTVGSVALVGGGFHDSGLHSVIEPAAAGLPVLFGPKHHSQRAAQDLIDAGGAKVVVDSTALAAALKAWTAPGGQGHEAGANARRYIEAHLGAARRTAEALAPYLLPHEVTPRGP